MVKSIITVLVSALIFIGGSICEQVYLNNSFRNFRERLIVVYEKTEDETITAYDVKSVQDLWIKNKKTLHVFISHNDIKELDMWISESLNYSFSSSKTALRVMERIRVRFMRNNLL